jgi:hypothetical protein
MPIPLGMLYAGGPGVKLPAGGRGSAEASGEGAGQKRRRIQARGGGPGDGRGWKGGEGGRGVARRRDAPIPLLPEARAIMSLQKTRATCSRVEEPNPKDATVSSLLEDCWPSTPLSSYEPGPGDSAASCSCLAVRPKRSSVPNPNLYPASPVSRMYGAAGPGEERPNEEDAWLGEMKTCSARP